MDEFARTRMGHEFLRGTLPRLVEQISRLADNIATLNETLSRLTAPKGVVANPPARPGP